MRGFFHRRSSAGFSLIEVVIVISVMAILSATLLAYNRSNADQQTLFRDRAIIISVLNRAKAMAVEKFYQNVDACAFGIFIRGTGTDPREFILFQDLRIDPEQDCKLEDGSYNFNNTYDEGEALSDYALGNRLVFDGALGDISVVFVPPELTILSTAGLPVTIGIKTVEGTFSTSLIVSEGGQIITP